MKKLIIITIAILFLQNGFAQIKIDRSRKPAAGAAPIITFKDPVIFNMSNGITVLVVENHKLPKVRANFSIDRGPVTEGKKAGCLDLLGGMLGEGTTTKNKDAFDEAVDAIGADVGLSSSGGNASALTRYFDKAFMLMADAIKNPSFPQESFDKLKSQTLTGLKSSEKSTAAIAARVSQALNYGKNSAQGEFTTEESVKALTLNDIKEAFKKYITPSRSYLTFVGDITPDAAKALATKAFGNWSGKKLELENLPVAKNIEKSEINFIDLPTAVQGELSAGNIITNPISGNDYHILLLANQILGGGAESKLFMNLREKHGFTYGAYSSVGSGRFPTLFKAGAAVRTDKVDSAVQEMMAEILNMRDGKITDEELASAKAKYNGSFALGMEDPARSATYASNILINNLPKDFYRTYLQKINAVTKDDIKNAAKTYFSENNSRIIIVGNGKKIIPNLMRLGYPIKKFDRYAEPVVEEIIDTKVPETDKAVEAVTANRILTDYLNAIGGKAEVEKVKSISSTFTIDLMGREMGGTEKKMAPNKSVMEMKMGAMTVFKKVFDGGKGYQGQMGQKKEYTEDEIKEATDDKALIPQILYKNTEYVGKGKISNEETYRLKVTYPSGKTAVQQYAIKSGLLLQEDVIAKINGADVNTTIEYKDYKKVSNILLPYNVVVNTDGQEFNIKYTEIKVNADVTDADFK